MADNIRTNFKKRAAAVAVASCLSFAPWLVEAASLGRITVLSGLGQPLRAEIEINASRAELNGMTARLAGQAAFREANIDYSGALADLRFSIEKRSNGTPVIKVSSGRPVSEPFLNFLVELNWASGPMIREYTFLLDPPEVAARAAARQATADARVVETTRGSGAAPTTGTGPETAKSAMVPRAPAQPKKTEESGSRVVQPGDTLRKIAAETKFEGVSLEQMLVGLFNKNPAAFSGENINRLKAGAILSLPDQAAVAAVSPAEARKFYQAQSEDWNSYRQKLASVAAKGQPSQDAATQASAGKIMARVEEKPSAADQAKDQVKVSRTEMASKGVAGGKAAPSSAAEADLIAKDKSLTEAQQRLALLEKNVIELQKLVDMKTQRLAELQEQASGRKEEAKPVVPVDAQKVIEPPKAPEPAPAVPAVEAPKPNEEAKPVEPPKPAEVKPVEQPAKVAVAPQPAPAEEFDALPLVGGGGIIALLIGYFLLRRRRSESAPESITAVPGPSSLGPSSVFRTTGGQSVDTGNVPLQTGDFSQTGPGTIDTDEVDPVAEADVYMAYGRDAQAEEILIEALHKDPQRTAIPVKLLEIYAGRKSLKQFDTLASELYAQTGGVGAEWEKVAAMGATLDPENPLYVGGMGTAAPEASPVAEEKSAVVLPVAAGLLAAGLAEIAAAAPELPAPEIAEEVVAEAAPEVAVDDAFASPVVADDVDALNFELGAAGELTEVAPAPAVEDFSMAEIEALDFDLGTSPQEPLQTTDADSQLAATDALATGAIDAEMDFSASYIGFDAPAGLQDEAGGSGMLDFELGDVAFDTQTVVNPGVLDESLNDEVGTDTVVNSMGLLESDEGALSATDVMGGGSVDLPTEDAEFDIKLSESAILGEPMPVPGFDLGSINLDLAVDPSDARQVVGVDEALSTSGTHDGDAGGEEVSTKLALAKAYEEMGDLDGARELLEEVIAEGGSNLAEQARQILGRMRG